MHARALYPILPAGMSGSMIQHPGNYSGGDIRPRCSQVHAVSQSLSFTLTDYTMAVGPIGMIQSITWRGLLRDGRNLTAGEHKNHQNMMQVPVMIKFNTCAPPMSCVCVCVCVRYICIVCVVLLISNNMQWRSQGRAW